MKRRDILRLLRAAGLTLEEGGSHTRVLRDGKLVTTVPRHNEVNELTTRGIERLTGVDLTKRRG